VSLPWGEPLACCGCPLSQAGKMDAKTKACECRCHETAKAFVR
jgi:hypothetical protein